MADIPETTKPTLLILSQEIKPTGVPGQFRAKHAVRTLLEAGRREGFRVIASPFDQFQFELRQAEQFPRIKVQRMEITADAAILRITGGQIAAARMIDRTLRAHGCVMLDSYDRFSGSALGKLELLMAAQGKRCDSDRLIVLTLVDLEQRLRAHDFKVGPKLVVKPADGFGGKMVRWVDGSDESIRAAIEMASTFKPVLPPIIIEPALDIAAEYRIYTLDDRVLGAARRIAAAPDMPANASQGAELVEEEPPAALLKAIAQVPTVGLVGWDVALTRNGAAVIIERNRPPSWKHFAEVSRVDIAGAVVALLKERLTAARARDGKTARA